MEENQHNHYGSTETVYRSEALTALLDKENPQVPPGIQEYLGHIPMSNFIRKPSREKRLERIVRDRRERSEEQSGRNYLSVFSQFFRELVRPYIPGTHYGASHVSTIQTYR